MIIQPTILIAIIIGITQIIKKIGVEKRYIPLVAIVLGIGLNFLTSFIGEYGSELLIGGIIASLSAMGLWSGVKTIIDK